MQIPDDLLFDIVKQVAGPDTINLVKVLKGKKNVSEFKIAEKMGISVNQVRNMIYRLQEYNLVSFTRKKDKTKGWYIYYWTFEMPKATILIIDIKEKELSEFKKELKELDVKRQYLCTPCRIKIPEEEALEAQFICYSCGEIMKEQDGVKRRKDLVKKIKNDEEGLKIALEIRDHNRKLAEKALERRLAKEKAEKDKERKKMLAKKKTVKKVVKKKVPVKKKTVKKTTYEPPKKRGLLRRVFKK